MEPLKEETKYSAESNSFHAELQSLATLRLLWNVDSDTLDVCRGSDCEVREAMQRVVWSFVSFILDPQGLISPFKMRMRLPSKSIYMQKTQVWDKELEEDRNKVLQWTDKLKLVMTLMLSRHYSRNELNRFISSRRHALKQCA